MRLEAVVTRPVESNDFWDWDHGDFGILIRNAINEQMGGNVIVDLCPPLARDP